APSVATYTITPRPVTAISGVTVASRAADGSATASFDTSAAAGTGVLPADLADFRAGGLQVSGAFPSTAAGTHDVAATYSLQDHGSFKAANYSLSTTTATLRGEIAAVSKGWISCVPAGFKDTTDDPDLINIYTLADLNSMYNVGEKKGYELMADLDFDTNGNGEADAGDTYWNGGSGFSAGSLDDIIFDGNGHTIRNLYVKGDGRVGLFSTVTRDAEIRNLRLESVNVAGRTVVGALVGWNSGKIIDVYATGTVNGNDNVGGLVGWGATTGVIIASAFEGDVTSVREAGGLVGTSSGGIIAGCSSGTVTNTTASYDSVAGGLSATTEQPGYVIASYSSSDVTVASGTLYAGGLMGFSTGPTTASYATGRVSGGVNPGGLHSYVGALIGSSPELTDSYWNKDSNPGFHTESGWFFADPWKDLGKTTRQLQSPTGYTGIYASWNVDLNGDGSPDDPWDFGTSGAYPTLKYSGLGDNPTAVGRPGGTDYDTDDDGLIEISGLAQLNAVRWDINGDGGPNRVGYRADYGAAFPDPATAMGCPSGGCIGYELMQNLDFDTNDSGSADAGDDYWNGGSGWTPIEDQGLAFRAVFDGNGHTISNLYINDSTSAAHVGLFRAVVYPGVVRNLGLLSASVTASYGNAAAGALVGMNNGEISGAYMTGSVSGSYAAGGLVGFNQKGGKITASYAAGSVSGNGRDVGGLVAYNVGEITAAYAIASVQGGDGVFLSEVERGGENVGGLVGYNDSPGVITASYAAGPVSGGGDNIGGLVGFNRSLRSDSYWATETSGQADSAAGTGKTTAELQEPTGYAGIYAHWNVDLDGDGSADDPWDFGASCQYPVLKYGSLNPDDQREPCEPTTTSPYSQVSAGHDHACALRLDGRIDCWGENEYGESTPPAGTFKQVSAGSHFTCAIKSGGATAGQVECWGKTE
ncbi:MAG: RCC1 domain-containing protein, partial [Chloroflexi bacterium]|nr:RCC1 domain-containing protein [Chloroflexota bacterium]